MDLRAGSLQVFKKGIFFNGGRIMEPPLACFVVASGLGLPKNFRGSANPPPPRPHRPPLSPALPDLAPIWPLPPTPPLPKFTQPPPLFPRLSHFAHTRFTFCSRGMHAKLRGERALKARQNTKSSHLSSTSKTIGETKPCGGLKARQMQNNFKTK